MFTSWFESFLLGVEWLGNRRGRAFCPLHEYRGPCLTLEGERGLWYCLSCHEGGTVFDLAARVGVDPPGPEDGDAARCYIYHGEDGHPLYRDLSCLDGSGWTELYVSEGRWRRGIRSHLLVPYRLPELLSAQAPVFLVEREEEVEALRSLGLVATTVAGGLGCWIDLYHPHFAAKDVGILSHNDEPGRLHAEEVAQQLHGIARFIRLLDLPDLPEKGDITSWLTAGHRKEELLSLLDFVPVYEGPSGQPEEASHIGSTALPPLAKSGLATPEAELPPFPESAWVGLLNGWRRLVGPSTEAPDAYLFAVFVAGLGLYLGRDFYLRHPRRIFQNYYFLIVGESALTRKSTAIGYGMDLCGRLDGEIKFSSGIASAEGVLWALAQAPGTRKIVFNDELRTLFANARRLGTQNILSSLNSLYEMPRVLSIDRRDPIEVKEGMFSMISATTPDWMSQEQEMEAAYGGFINRHLCLAGEAKGPIALPKPPGDGEWDRLIESIQSWRGKLPPEGGEILLGESAARFYTDWYRDWYRERKFLPEAISSLLKRVDGHVIKLSAFFCLMNCQMEIRREDVKRAIEVIDHSSACCRLIFKDITLSKRARLEEKIRGFLTSGPLSRREIQRKLGKAYDLEDTQRALKALVESGEVWGKEDKGRPGRPSWRYGLVLGEE